MRVASRPIAPIVIPPLDPDGPLGVRADHRAISLPVVARLAWIVDLAMLIATVTVGAYRHRPGDILPGQAALAAAAFVGGALWTLGVIGSYRPRRMFRVWRKVIGAAIGAVMGGLALVAMGALATGQAIDLTAWAASTSVAAAVLLIGRRLILAVLLRQWRAEGRLVRNVAIVGANDYSRSFIEATLADPGRELNILGLYDDRASRVPTGITLPILGNVDTLLTDSRATRIDVIVVALPLLAADRISQIRDKLSPTVSDIFLTADTAGLRYDGRDFEALGRNGVIRVGSRPLSDWDATLKQGFDLLGAAVLLVLLSPLLLTVAALIRLGSPGPALFRQPRTGFNNKPFVVLKFRTMHTHLTDLHADRQTTRNDPRVTMLGRFLRRSSIDELPQLINVLRGEMSLVGPRPHAANTKAADRFFDDVVAEYALRHRIKPGITGWAQVNGWRGETPQVEQIQQRVAFDLAYVENWSLMLDLKILFMTVFGGKSAGQAY